MNSHPRITIALLILAVFSAASIALTARNYVQGTKVAGSLRFQLSTVELRQEAQPEVLVTFHIQNRSPTSTIAIEAFDFSLHLNRNFMGSNYAPFTVRTLGSLEQTSFEIVIPIQPFYLQHIEQAQQGEGCSLVVRGRAKLVLPAFQGKEIWVNIREQLSESP